MRIIEYGDVPPKRTKCIFCNAKFEYTPADVIFSHNEMIIECPVCKAPMLYKGDEDD